MVAAVVFVGTMLMMTRRRGRAFLLHSLKEMVRPALAFLVATLAAAIVGGALMGYFEWRARLRRRTLEDGRSERRAA